MVKPDSSARSAFSASDAREPSIAPVADRLLSFLIDFMIFSPVLSLLGAGLLQEVRTHMLVREGSPEASVTWILFVGWVVFGTFALHALALKFFSSTPGQRFTQLRVVSFPEQGPLRWSQCLQRSLFWCVSLAAGAVPFLEVFTHSKRRAFHDRASDTMVVTLRPDGDQGPIEIEARFFSSWLRGFALIALTVFFVSGLRVREMVRTGEFTRAVLWEEGRFCERIPESFSGARRLDVALAMFLSEQVDAECVGKEADGVLWGGIPEEGISVEEKSLAALLKYYIENDDEKKAGYRELACAAGASNEICGIAEFDASKDENRADILRRKGLGFMTSRVLLLDESLRRRQYLSAVALIEDLRSEKLFSAALGKSYVRAVWGLAQPGVADRAPASAEKSRIVERFKERYGIE